jgi:integrase
VDQPEIAGNDLAACRAGWCLARFYDCALAPWRRRQLGRGEVAAGTLQKERQSLACFDAWDQSAQPDNWPAGHIWRGLPCSYLRGGRFEQWAADRLQTLSIGTVESRWCALRTVLNCAIDLGAMDRQKLPNLAPLFESRRNELALLGDYDDFVATTYTLEQLEAVYLALASEPDLQTAWLIGSIAGPRTVDLFSLRWGMNIKLPTPGRLYGELFYTARKTGKKHWVPLPQWAIAHLRRLADSQRHLIPGEPEGLVFPRLTAGASKDPEKSRAARARNDRLKAAMVACGLDADRDDSDFHKPIQVLRSTCNSRLNNHRAGKGLLVTHGKDADVSSQSYWNERDSIIEAVMSLPQPPAFLCLN